jgi:hypothetical protein
MLSCNPYHSPVLLLPSFTPPTRHHIWPTRALCAVPATPFHNLLKSLLDAITHNPGSKDERVVLPMIRTLTSINSGSGPDAAATFTGIPSDPRSTMFNEEFRIGTQLRLGLPLANYHDQPHAPCPHGCRHPQTYEESRCAMAGIW